MTSTHAGAQQIGSHRGGAYGVRLFSLALFLLLPLPLLLMLLTVDAADADVTAGDVAADVLASFSEQDGESAAVHNIAGKIGNKLFKKRATHLENASASREKLQVKNNNK